MIAPAYPRLTDFAATYCARKLGLSRGYMDLLKATARQFSQWVGHDVRTNELTPELLSAWLTWLVDTGRCNRVTANGKRRNLLTLWRSAAIGSLAQPPGVIERFREPRNIPEAWTVAEVEAIVVACRRQPGMVGQIPAALWWPSLVLAVYWTATRIGALLRCRSCDCSIAGRWLLIGAENQKNARAQLHQIPDQAIAAIAAHYDPARVLLWPWPFHRRTLFNRFRRIVESAGVPCPRTGRNLFHRMRRTSLSYQWAADPAIAQRTAGHASPAMTYLHYVDPRIAQQRSAADVLPMLHF